MDSVTTGCGYGQTCSASAGRVQGVCPDGWHLPSAAEWDTLFATVGGSKTAGTMLKSSTGWENNGNGEDAVGFTVLPSGSRSNSGSYKNAVKYADFWSSSEYSTTTSARTMYLHYDRASASLGSGSRGDGYVVRCVKNE